LDLKIILEMGAQPPANSLHDKNQLPDEVPLTLVRCNDCNVMQLRETIEPEYLFKNYNWVTGTGKATLEFAARFPKIIEEKIGKVKNVLEIASNDGTFLKFFKENNIEALGIEPALNIARIARESGIQTENIFFNLEAAKYIKKKYSPFELIVARNVIPHIENLKSVAEGIYNLLSDRGTLVIEFHYAGDIMDGLQYDSIYHEHIFYFTAKSLKDFFEKNNLFMFDCDKSPLSGGSLIAYFSTKERCISDALRRILNEEKLRGLNLEQSWLNFAVNVEKHKISMKKILERTKGARKIAYGASARSSTLMNYCGINEKTIEYIIDNSPLKQGKYTPGSNIKIIPLSSIDINSYQYIFITAWNFQKEIMESLEKKDYKNKYIIPLPVPKII
jgi:hypothetical protein